LEDSCLRFLLRHDRAARVAASRVAYTIMTQNSVPHSSQEGRIHRMFTALLCFGIHSLSAGAEDTSNCVDLGFTGMQLCSDCDALKEFVKDDGLQAECEQCCAKESKRELKKNIKYTSGSLEICQ